MFVQIIKGKTKDPAGLRRQVERWEAEVRPGAAGFLGSTGGVTDDGTLIVFARFADQAAAIANSNRAEQGAWWEATAKYFAGTPTFRESSDVTTLFDGGSDDAGFLQLMEGTVKDRAAAEAFETPEMKAELHAARPDLLGSTRAWFPDGTFAEVAYFTSEEAARKGESSADFSGTQQEYMDLYSDMTFSDIREPLLVS